MKKGILTMKHKTSLILFIVVFSLTLQQRTEAQTAVRHSVVSNGGNGTSNSQFRIAGTVGQPAGLKSVADYPNLIYHLLERGYSEADIKKILSGNVLRVWQEVNNFANARK